MMEKTAAIQEIEQYLRRMKQYRKSFLYYLDVNCEAAAIFIRLPEYDSEWTYTTFECVRELCQRYPYAAPFFSVEAFPYYAMPQRDGYDAKYMGIDLSHYQYPEIYPPITNHFAVLNGAGQ
jgi:hypothetical protein